MLLNVALPSSAVFASHLFRHSLHDLSLDLLMFDDINDPKNGLLLFKPIELAFDKFQLSFILDKEENYYLKLWDSTLRSKLLIDSMTD